ncbi:MAG: PD40 domain-containing protein [Phycisphaerales bacterium]|nr:MAG: PD40 domain-containing protein [Phycisphaerales bacterium]
MKSTRILALVFLVLGPAVHAVKADFTFGDPVDVESVIPVLDGAYDAIDCFSRDGLEMFIDSNRSGSYGNYDIYVLRRDSQDAQWNPPENLGPAVNSASQDSFSFISDDELTLYFNSNRPGGEGGHDIYMTRRTTRNDPWGEAENMGSSINSSAIDGGPWISPDGLEFYFVSTRDGGYGASDIYVARRATPNDAWGVPVNLGPMVNSAYCDDWFSLSPDGLLLLFSDHQGASSFRPGGYGQVDMWMSRRTNTSQPWQSPVNLGPIVNGFKHDGAPRLSLDGRTLYFWSNRSGSWGNYQAQIIPLVDFNRDEIVDSADVRIMVDQWGEDYPLCDIGPMPWGDGIVDTQDLIVLSEYFFEEVLPADLVAYWKLDESEGNVAHESIGGSQDVVTGSPQWQPTGGKVGGALELDGVDDCVTSDVGPNPVDGPFGILVWVKGGTPGQVIVSQPAGANWLMADADGKLTTELASAGRDNRPLSSQTIITDGQWHRIGLVWDGLNRALRVDGIVVAEDTQSSIQPSAGGLHIGTGKDLASGTYFSGLIDDVRLYDYAISGSAIDPDPADGAQDVDIAVPLRWKPGLQAMMHDVYFGTSSPPAFIGKQEVPVFYPGLQPSTTYYWRIDEFDGTTIRTGDIWSFTTAPGRATQPRPADGALVSAFDTILSWLPGPTAATHNVYFGTTSPPPFIQNQEATTYDPGPLEPEGTYYWQIDEVEADGTTIHTGDVWSFTTEAISVQKGPYLIYPGDNTQMMVLWQMNGPEPHTLRWGQDTSYADGSITPEMVGDYQYEHIITSLTPGRKYYYEVEGVGSGSFFAAPPEDAAKVKFLAYGDTRTNPDIHDAVNAQMIAAYTADPAYQTFTMLTGDWVTNGDVELDWTDQFFNRSQENTMQMQANLPINGCIGNHERSGAIFGKYWPYPYESDGWYWSFDYGPAHIVMVDLRREGDSLGDTQKAWLEADLAGSTKEWKFLQFHAPVYSAGHHANNVIEQAYIQSLCETYGVAMVFAGHNHCYARAMVNGIAHITTGGGGAPLRTPEPGQPNIVASDQSNHFCKIDIQGRQLTFEAVRVDGTVIETFTMSH